MLILIVTSVILTSNSCLKILYIIVLVRMLHFLFYHSGLIFMFLLLFLLQLYLKQHLEVAQSEDTERDVINHY